MHFSNARTFFLSLALVSHVGVSAGYTQGLNDLTPRQANAFDYAYPFISRREGFNAVRDEMLQAWSVADLDDELGIQASDSAISRQIADAKLRSSSLANFFQFDLNSDGQVTADEMSPIARRTAGRFLRASNTVIEPTLEQRNTIYQAELARLMKPDLNKDGVIDISEMTVPKTRSRIRQDLFDFMQFDRNADGTTDRNEILAAFQDFKSIADQNGDNQLDPAERALLVQTWEERRLLRNKSNRNPQLRALDQLAKNARAKLPQSKEPFQTMAGRIPATCKSPAAREFGDIYAIAGFEGAGLSNLRIGDDNTQTTHVVDVIIPEGEGVATLYSSFARPTVLRLSGATDRLKHVVSDHPIAVVAPNRSRLLMMALDTSCRQKVWPARSQAVPSIAPFIGNLFGKSPKGTVTGYTLGTVMLATLQNDTSKIFAGGARKRFEGKYAPFWEGVLRSNPGGIIDLSDTSIQTKEFYEIYPQMPEMAGLIGLLEEGALTAGPRQPIRDIVKEFAPGVVRLAGKTFRPGGGDDLITVGSLFYSEEQPGKWVARAAQQFLVNRKISLPTGLVGSHSALEFVVPDGVPTPIGIGSISVVHGVENFSPGTRSR